MGIVLLIGDGNFLFTLWDAVLGWNLSFSELDDELRLVGLDLGYTYKGKDSRFRGFYCFPLERTRRVRGGFEGVVF